MKLPAFQFYPGDWWKDPGVKMLNLQERGFWLQCLMLMHEADERGKLTVNGRPMPMDGLAMIMGIRTKEVEKIVEKLVAHGVASMDETGVLYSRRMVRDEGLRKVRAEGGKLGGNPALMDKRKVRGKVNLPDNLAPTPSSSSSISSSDIPPYPQGGEREPEDKKLKAKGTLDEVLAFFSEVDLPTTDAEWFFHKCEGCGWTNGGKPIKNWKATVRQWKLASIFPSLKPQGFNGRSVTPAPQQTYKLV